MSPLPNLTRCRPVVLALLLAVPGMPATATAATGADRLQGFLANVTSLEARFEESITDSRQQTVERASGTLLMQKPGRFRWNYVQPFERVIVADGEKLWLYEADLDQVTVRRLTAGLGDTPAALLSGRESVLERFVIRKSWRADGLDYVRLEPRAAESDFAGVTLGFDGPVLRRLLLDDRLGQRTRIDLSAVQLNPRLPADSFRFVPPLGADVIDDSDL